MKDLLFKLCEFSGVSGDETLVSRFVSNHMSKYAEISVDSFNNVIAEMGDKDADKTVLLDAHIDRIGFIITGITDDGFLKVEKCGGIDLRTALDAPVIVHGAKNLKGIICCMPPHLSDGKEDKAPDIESIYIDLGIASEKVKELVSVGDYASFCSIPKELLNGRVTAAALDNRAGVCSLLRVAELISGKEIKCRVVFSFTCQEETFATGAKTTSFKYHPDECICVDVSFASQPGITDQYSTIKLGKGPMLLLSPNLNRIIFNSMKELCDINNIPYQLETAGGRTGTNADSIVVSGKGVKTAVVSIPQKNMHTQAEIVSLDDIENTAKLIALYLEKGGSSNE